MSFRNIILLGGSNSILRDGFQKGLKDAIEQMNLKNLARDCKVYKDHKDSATSLSPASSRGGEFRLFTIHKIL